MRLTFFYLLPAVDNDWAGATSVAFIHLSDQQRWETARESQEEKDKQRKHKKCSIGNYYFFANIVLVVLFVSAELYKLFL